MADFGNLPFGPTSTGYGETTSSPQEKLIRRIGEKVYVGATRLGLPYEVIERATKLVEAVPREKLIGKRPSSLAAGAIYIASQETAHPRTQAEIAGALEVSTPSLRKARNLIRPTAPAYPKACEETKSHLKGQLDSQRDFLRREWRDLAIQDLWLLRRGITLTERGCDVDLSEERRMLDRYEDLLKRERLDRASELLSQIRNSVEEKVGKL